MTVDGIVKQYVCIASDGIAASTHRGDHIGPRRDAYPVGATLCGRPYGMNVRYAFADLRRSSRKRYCRGVGARPLRFALGRPVSPAEHCVRNIARGTSPPEHCVHRPRNIACIAPGTLRASPAEHCVHRPRNIACIARGTLRAGETGSRPYGNIVRFASIILHALMHLH